MTNSFYILKKTTRAATDPRGEAFPRYVNKCMCLVRNHHEAFSWSPLFFFFFFAKAQIPVPLAAMKLDWRSWVSTSSLGSALVWLESCDSRDLMWIQPKIGPDEQGSRETGSRGLTGTGTTDRPVLWKVGQPTHTPHRRKNLPGCIENRATQRWHFIQKKTTTRHSLRNDARLFSLWP